MNRTAIVLFAILSAPALACTDIDVVPPHIGPSDSKAANQHIWKSRFSESSVVVGVEVIAIRVSLEYSLIDVKPFKVWKTDGSEIHHLLGAGRADGVSCTPSFKVGARYIVFSSRSGFALASPYVTSAPLQVLRSVPETKDAVEFLNGLSRTTPERSASPLSNISLERHGWIK